jgi:predicted hydrocarbon binding protein
MGYRSPRRLCALAEGFIEAAATHFGEAAVIEQPTCMRRGDAECEFKISLTRQAA